MSINSVSQPGNGRGQLAELLATEDLFSPQELALKGATPPGGITYDGDDFYTPLAVLNGANVAQVEGARRGLGTMKAFSFYFEKDGQKTGSIGVVVVDLSPLDNERGYTTHDPKPVEAGYTFKARFRDTLRLRSYNPDDEGRIC